MIHYQCYGSQDNDFIINLNAGDMSNFVPFFPFISLASLFQPTTVVNGKKREADRQPVLREGLDVRTAVDLQAFKRGKAPKPLLAQ